MNIIGEHIDYEGYSVLPMAIGLDTIVACGPRNEANIHVANMSKEVDDNDPDKVKYEAGTLPIDPSASVSRGSWLSYVHAAYKGVHEFQAKKSAEAEAGGEDAKTNESGKRKRKAPTPSWEEDKGLNLLVDGRVPPGSGLSSSSALVCSVAVAVMRQRKFFFTKEEVAEFTRVCEKYVGTMSGGMDQAISIMGERGFAKLIDFNPVRAHSVPLPLGGIFVIANTIVQSLKAVEPEAKYNLRVVECTLAAILLALKLEFPKKEALALTSLKQVQDLMGDQKTAPVEVLKEHLHSEPYAKADLEGVFGVKLEEIFKENEDFLAAVEHASAREGFNLYNRAWHVYTEAARVYSLKRLCGDETSKDKFAQIGEIMSESHRSCRTLYQCSSEELDELVELAMENGAYGARLTGAGWGGCIVAYVSENNKKKFIENIYCSYYKKHLDAGKITQKQLKNCIFPSKPSAGACVIVLGSSDPVNP